MRTLVAAGNVIKDIVELTIVQPVREGRLRGSGWPAGLAAIVASILILYGVLTLAVVFAGPLRSADTLLVTATGLTIPDTGAWLCIAGIVLSLALLQTAALHLPWWVTLFSLLTVTIALLYFATAGATDPALIAGSVVGLLVLLVLTIARRRAAFAWWEFVVVALALAGAVFVPLTGSGASRSLNTDWRGFAVEGGLQTLGNLAMPALFVAGAALAQLGVTAAFAGVSATTRELPRGPQLLTAMLLIGWAGFELVRAVDDPENAPSGWLGSALALALIAVLQVGVLAVAGRPPAWDDLDEDSTRVNYLVVIASMTFVLIQPVPTVLREIGRSVGPDWLYTASDGYLGLTSSDSAFPLAQFAVGAIGLGVAVSLARSGRPWTAMFLSSFTALVLFGLFRHLGFHAWAGTTVPQLSALLLVVLLAATVVLLIGHRLNAVRAAALASGILLCVIYPHRAILDDPISALLGFSGIGAVLFGLIWRVLTEGDITQEGSPRWPVPARVLLYCASALLGVTSAAFVALTRSSGGILDVAMFADAGDYLLGTPLFVTAVLGCLAIALLSPRPAAG